MGYSYRNGNNAGCEINEGVLIEDAAVKPHVVDLTELTNKMGVKVVVVGTNTLSIKGKKGVFYKVLPD